MLNTCNYIPREFHEENRLVPSEIISGLINDSVLSQINLIASAKILSLYSQNRLLYYYRPPYWLRAWGMRVIQSHKFLRASAISPYHPMHMPNFGQQRRPTKKLGSIKHHPTGWFLLDESYGIHFLSCTKCIPSKVTVLFKESNLFSFNRIWYNWRSKFLFILF